MYFILSLHLNNILKTEAVVLFKNEEICPHGVWLNSYQLHHHEEEGSKLRAILLAESVEINLGGDF